VHQGKGIGTQLMRPLLDRCDAEHMPAYLESTDIRNNPLYERLGYKVTEVLDVPHSGPRIWCMWREPQ
jgi:GNAT superfamily N-acetyltransferase